MRFHYLFAIFVLAMAARAQTTDPLRLVVNDQASMPYLMGEGEALASPPGLAVELVQAAAQACHVPLQIVRQPGLRQLQNLRNGTQDAALLLSYSPERARFLYYPMQGDKPDERFRLTTLRYSFYVHKDSPIRWDGKKLQGFSGQVGTDLGWSVAQDLAKRGIPVENAVGVAANLAKLRAGHIQIYAAQNLLADYYLQGSKDIVALKPPIAIKAYFLPFSQQYQQYHPQVVHCIWQQIAAHRDSLYRERAGAYSG